MMTEEAELLEIFKDFEVEVEGISGNKRYRALYHVVKKENPKRVTLEDLENYAKRLSEKYKGEKFAVEKQGEFYVLVKKSGTLPSLPIYFYLENQRFFVRKEDYLKNKRLANYIIMRVLGALGVVTEKYGGRI